MSNSPNPGDVVGGTLTSTCSNGKSHHHTLAKEARVTCDGKACELADMKTGMLTYVTTTGQHGGLVMAVEARK